MAHALLNAAAMNIRFLPVVLAAFSCGCSSSSSGPSDSPVIDDLEVPATTSTLTVDGQSGPGVELTLSAHDPSAGIDQLHIVFTETNVDQPIAIPGNPTTIRDQSIEFVVVGAPSGPHTVDFHVTNVDGVSSATITKTITVP